MKLVACFVLGLAGPALAQIAPECRGVTKPADYSEDRQQAFLQNYFATSLILTPMSPIVAYDDPRATFGLELGLVPPLSCEHRLVLDGTKTEDTNKLPVVPRPRFFAQLPKIGPLSPSFGVTFVPPVPSPLGTMLMAGTDVSLGWKSSDTGVAVGARGHMTFARMRAEIAEPFKAGDPAVDDLFFASLLGADVDIAWSIPWDALAWLTPYASAGVADASTLFLVGDDYAIVQNVKEPWWGATGAVGLRVLLFDDHLNLTLEGSAAVPILWTVKGFVGGVW